MFERLWTRALLAGVVCVASGAQAQEWTHAGGDSLASGLLSGVGAMTSDVDDLPGIAWGVTLSDTAFAPDQIQDIDGDGDFEVVLPFRQRVAAFDLVSGDLVWATPPLGVTHVLPPVDLLCSGTPQTLAVNANMGGGIHLVDPETGAVFWTFSELDGASGVQPAELVIADVDGDSCDELVFGPFLNERGELYVADLSTVDSIPRVAVGELTGGYRQVIRMASGDYDGDGVANEIVLFEREAIDVKQVCAPAAGGDCDPIDGSLCLCDLAFFDQVFPAPTYAFPMPYTVNADGGADEVLFLGDHPTFLSALGVLSVEAGLAAPQANSQLGGWFYDYRNDNTRMLDTGAPVDLDGSASDEIVVSLFDAGTGEVDWDGAATDDGVANADGFTVAVFDLGTGDLLASVDDRYALGMVDLDGDGSMEIVTAVTSDWTFTGGGTEAYELNCTASPCTLDSAWTSSHRGVRFPASYDDAAFPPRSVAQMLSGGQPAIGLYDGSDLVSLTSDGSTGLTELGRQTLSDEDNVAIAAADVDALLVALDTGFIAPYDGALSTLGAAYRPQSQATGRMHAVVMSDTEDRAIPIVDGFVFHSAMAPGDPSEADVDLGGDLILAQDLDGDGMTDLISYRELVSDGSFEITRHEYTGNGAFAERWSFSSAGTGSLVGHSMLTLWQVTAYDWSGDGVDEVLVALHAGSNGRMLALDGATGMVDWDSPTGARPSYYAPLIPMDVISSGTWGTVDGTVDVVRPTLRRVTGWEYGEAAAAQEYLTSDFNSQWAAGDLDGNGRLDIVTGLTGRLDRAQLESWNIDPVVQLGWGPVSDIGAPPDVEQGIALADLDTRAGLDVVYISSEGRIDAASGEDGATVPGFPYYLGEGVGDTSPIVPRQALTAVIAADVDGDGLDEIVVGSRAGYVYAVNAADGEGGVSVEWSFFLGAAVVRLAGGDVDGDGEIELLVSAEDGVARAIDGIGASVEIVLPQPDDCVSGRRIVVAGESTAIESVEVFVQGAPQGQTTPDSAGNWFIEVDFPLVNGVVEIQAIGLTGGVGVVVDAVNIQSAAGDLDADGFTTCGGDCDDSNADINPGAEEVCDGIDNDCDPDTEEAIDADADGVSNCDEPPDCDDAEAAVFPQDAEPDCEDGLDNDCDGTIDADDTDCQEDATPPPDGGPSPGGCDSCDCESNQGGGRPGPWMLLAGLSVLAVRRRRVR